MFADSRIYNDTLPIIDNGIIRGNLDVGGTITGSISSTSIGIPGEIIMYGSATAPDGWLLCNGDIVSTAIYPDLFAVIGYTFGGFGPGFALPDLRGRMAIGTGTGPGLSARALGDTGGEETHTLLEAELASHSHTVNVDGSDGGGDTPTGEYLAKAGGGEPIYTLGGAVGTPATMNAGMIADTGSDTPFNVMAPFLALNFIIKT